MLKDPRLLIGDAMSAYRDPAAIFHEGVFHLYYTFVDNQPDGPWMYVAESTSTNFEDWTPPRLLTPKDHSLNYSSPGNIVHDGEDWVICFQTYCRENGEKYGNENCRLYTMRSKNLIDWSEPTLLRVKGDVPFEKMGRMIDPFLIKKEKEWWCFFKQNGISYSKSSDLIHWQFVGHTEAGENPCIIRHGNGYRMFSSPYNGIRVMDSTDLVTWHRVSEDLTLGQSGWDWARNGRLTAAFVMENSALPDLPRYIMFFHATVLDEEKTFDNDASIAVAFSHDLETWFWPGKD